MNTPLVPIGVTTWGEDISFRNLRELSLSRLGWYAHELVGLSDSIADTGKYEISAPLFGYAHKTDVFRQMLALRRSGSTRCNLVYVDSDLAGVAITSSRDAGDTPLPLARPRNWSTKFDYWLVPEFHDDVKANTAVARRLVQPRSNEWQWTLLNPHYHETKATTYRGLGLSALVDSTEWVETLGSGRQVLGAELWARAPSTDNPILAQAMTNLQDVIRQEYKDQDRAEDARFQ